MLIHLTPRLFTSAQGGHDWVLDRLEVPEFGLTLKGGVDVVSRRPFPNKRYLVGSPPGRRHYVGVLFSVDRRLDAVSYVATWRRTDGRVAVHAVRLRVVDQDFDAVTDCVLAWRGLPGWAAREVPQYRHLSVTEATPCLDLEGARAGLARVCLDTLEAGVIARREEDLDVPTVEADRLSSPFYRFSIPAPSLAIGACIGL